MVAIVDSYAHWLAESPIPKPFVNADPGTILTGAQIMIRPCRTPIVTASVRLPALSLAKMEAM